MYLSSPLSNLLMLFVYGVDWTLEITRLGLVGQGGGSKVEVVWEESRVVWL